MTTSRAAQEKPTSPRTEDVLRRLQEQLYRIPTHGKSALYFRAAVDEILDTWIAERRKAAPADIFTQGVHDGFWPNCDKPLPHLHLDGAAAATPSLDGDHLLAMVEVVSLYKSQHDDECNCEACNAYEAATDEVEPWTPEAAAATFSLDGLEAEVAEIVAAELFSRLMPGYGTLDAPMYAGTDHAVKVYRQHGASVARKVIARLDEGSATPQKDEAPHG